MSAAAASTRHAGSRGALARTPRVLRAGPVEDSYGVAFGAHLYAAACGAPPLAEYRCTKSEPVAFIRQQGSDKPEDVYDVSEEGCALPGDILVADCEKSGWVRVIGGAAERWLPIQGSGLERVERPRRAEDSAPPVAVPPGWEVLSWQVCQGGVLKKVIAGFEWGADTVLVQDSVQGRLLRVGTKRSDRPGTVLGDACNVTIAKDGTLITCGSEVVLITRPMIGVSWGGEDVFHVTGLLNDPSYAAASSSAFGMRPMQRELEAAVVETSQQALASEVRAWFAPSPPSNHELLRAATREAAALRRLWGHDLLEKRLLRVREGLAQLPAPTPEDDEADAAELGADAATRAAAAAVAEEDFDPVQIWVQVALGSIIELAACTAALPGQEGHQAFERLIVRGTRTFSSASPLSLFGAGKTSRLCVDETVSALCSLVESMPALRPAGLDMLLALATVTGAARFVALALQWLFAVDDDVTADAACARRCTGNLAALWHVGSAMHFETQKLLDSAKGDSAAATSPMQQVEGRKKDAPAWSFAHLASCGRHAAPTAIRLRSHRTVSFEEPLPGGVYWEVTLLSSDPRSTIVGVWLESKKKPIGCLLADGSAAGAGAEAAPAEPLPAVKSGSIFGCLASIEELVVTCDGHPFSRISYKKLLVTGERVALYVEQGAGTQLQINVGQEPLQHLPAAQAEATTARSPTAWGSACDPFSPCPYKPFVEGEPQTCREVADLLLQISERNVGRWGASIDSGTPVQHTFAKSDQMNTTDDGTVVNNIREQSWARVDCEISAGVSVEFVFDVLEDRENDEGTCYGISTADCTKYDSKGAIVIRGYSGRMYCDGVDKGEKFPKIHPRSRVGFRFDYSEGRLEGWLNNQEPRLLVNDPNVFAGRTFYPTVFNYHGVRTKVKLVSCNSGLRSRRSALQDAFVLEVSAAATVLWMDILEQLLQQAMQRGARPADQEVTEQEERLSHSIGIVLKVLLATANMSDNPWVEFGAIRSRLMEAIDFVVIERRNDPMLRKPRDIGILLISVLGVGALFGGPEQVLKVFLSVRDSEASRLGQTLVAYLLKTRRSASIAGPLLCELSKLAVTDELGCQILLRLTLNAFAGGVAPLVAIATGALELAEAAFSGPGGPGAAARAALAVTGSAAVPSAAPRRPPPGFFAEYLPVLAQLLAALPRREPPEATPQLLQLLAPATKLSASLRAALRSHSEEWPRFLADVLHGLNAFVCGVAGRLMACTTAPRSFPLDLGDAELRDSAACPTQVLLPAALVRAEAAVEEVVGPAPQAQMACPALPEVVTDILEQRGAGEALVQALQQKLSSQGSKQPVSPVQRAAFAAAVLCKGPAAWEAVAEATVDPTSGGAGAVLAAAWRAAVVFTSNKVRSMKQSIAANEGNATSFEQDLAKRLAWLVRSVAWPPEEAAPGPGLLERAFSEPAPGPGSVGGNGSTSPASVVSGAVPPLASGRSRGYGSPGGYHRRRGARGAAAAEAEESQWHFSLARAQAQLVDEVSGEGTAAGGATGAAGGQATAAAEDLLIAAAAAQRDAALSRRSGLRLLRHLVVQAAAVEGIEPLLPALQAALDETLSRPLAGIAHSGVSRRRAVLTELAGLLREVHDQCLASAAAAGAVASPTVGALGLAMMCVPLPREELEHLLGGSMLGGLPSIALDARGCAGNCCRAHAAQLVLRTYIAGRSRGRSSSSRQLALVLAKIATTLDTPVPASLPGLQAAAPVQSPLAEMNMDPLQVDWDFGAFGRLCSRKVNVEALRDAWAVARQPAGRTGDVLPQSSGDCNIGPADAAPTEPATAAVSSTAAGSTAPATALPLFKEAKQLCGLTLKELRQQRSRMAMPDGVVAGLILRLPQAAHDEAELDAVEVAQMLLAANGAELPWQDRAVPGARAAALSLLRPAAELLTSDVPRIVERLLAVAHNRGSSDCEASGGGPFHLPASLAVCLYMKLQLPDDQVARDAPRLLELLGSAEQVALSGSECRGGALVFANVLVRQLTSRASAMAGAVLGALQGFSVQHPPSSRTLAALGLLGGPMHCAACQMQVLNTSFGRSLVVAADAQRVAGVALDGAADAKAVQWIRWSELPTHAREVSVGAATARAAMWGEAVVGCLLTAVQQFLANGGGTREQRVGQQLLRALAAVLPVMPCWDVAIVTEVVRELDTLAAAGVGDGPSSSIELLEHHCTLLRLALARREEKAADGTAKTAPLDTELVSNGDSYEAPDGITTAERQEAGRPREEGEASGCSPVQCSTAAPAASGGTTPSVLEVLNQGIDWWRGKYKLIRHTKTWAKSKWQMELHLTFRAGGGLDVVAKWPKFSHPSSGQNARWHLEPGDAGVCVEYELELPGNRREGGRTRDCEVFTWKGHLVQSRGCPHFEGTAAGRTSDLRYEWYAVPPDPLVVLRATDLNLFGRPDELLPRPFSLLSFHTGFTEQKAAHFGSTLGLSKFVHQDCSARDLAGVAVAQLTSYRHIRGPSEVAKFTKRAGEENWGMHDSLEEEADTAAPGTDERWCSVQEVFGEGRNLRSAAEIAITLKREERQLRQALLMRLLQVMLAQRPPNTAIADSFPEPAAREAFFKRALRLPDAGAVLQRCRQDFAASPDVSHSALTAAVEGLLLPFMAGGVSTIAVESDHDYHPNEDWIFRLSIPGAQRMKLKFDSRCKTEQSRDFLQFFGERDASGRLSRRLHTEEKLCGQYPAGFPDLHFPGDRVWMKFQSDNTQEFWGFRFTLSAEGAGAGAAAVPFPAALQLLVAIASALEDEEQHSVRLMGASVLLSVAAAQPLSDEATRAAEAMCELLPEPYPWSDTSWCAALSLMSVAERNGCRQLLASLVTLLSGQMGPQPPPSWSDSDVPMPVLLDHVRPPRAGLLLNGRTTLVASGGEPVAALGLPVPLLAARAGRPLFCVRVEPMPLSRGGSGLEKEENAMLRVGVALPVAATAAVPAAVGCSLAETAGDEMEAPGAAKDELLDQAICCDISSFAAPEVSVEVRRFGSVQRQQRLGAEAHEEALQLIVTGPQGQRAEALLPAVWCKTQLLRPVLQMQGFGASLTLLPSPGGSLDSQAAAVRLGQLQRTSRLVEACRGGREMPLPAALVAGAWTRREGGDEAAVAAVRERLRARCAAVAESSHPHSWTVERQRLHVAGAPALELSFPKLEIAEGHRLRVTHDAAGELPVMRCGKVADDSAIKHTVEYGKYLFGTLDGISADSREKGQQENWLKVPSGWELVPAQADIVQEVIAKQRWGTAIVIMGSGDAYYTLNHEDGSKAGQAVGKDKLSSRGAEPAMEFRPSGSAGRILARRLRPGLGTAAVWCAAGAAVPLRPEELAPGESVIVSGSTVYVHGPVPQLRSWDQLLPTAKVSGDVQVPPQLCAGPWTWELSPAHHIAVLLTPEGEVRLSSTSLPMLEAAPTGAASDVVAKAEESTAASGAAAAARDAVQGSTDVPWVDPAKFRLAKVTGTWDPRTRASISMKLEGADDLGAAEILFQTTAVAPVLQGEAVSVEGEMLLIRWGTHKVSVDGCDARPSSLSSAWRWPWTQEPAVEVLIESKIEPPAALSVEVLVGSQLTQDSSTSRRDLLPLAGTNSKVRQSMVLHEGEHVLLVRGNCCSRSGPLWVEVATSQGRRFSWPPEAQCDSELPTFESAAPEFCEIMGFSVSAAAENAKLLSFRPLALTSARPFQVQRLPDGAWEGVLELAGTARHDVRWQLGAAATGPGSFEAMLTSTPAASALLDASPGGCNGSRGPSSPAGVVHGKVSPTGAVAAEFWGCRLEGRCSIDSQRRVTMVLAREGQASSVDTAAAAAGAGVGGTPSMASRVDSDSAGVHLGSDVSLRIVVCSKSSASPADGGVPMTLDGPRLIFYHPNKQRCCQPGERYFVHTARSVWTQQVAIDSLVAEVAVRHLDPSCGCGGLFVGVAANQGSEQEPPVMWPGQSAGRWLWRGDGAVAHAAVSEQRCRHWRFGPGDRVGFAVSNDQVDFLKNGERVHSVPRRPRGDAELPGRGGGSATASPTLVVGLACDAVLELCRATQYPQLMLEHLQRGPLCCPALVQRSRAAESTRRRRLKQVAHAVVAAGRLLRIPFSGPPAWPAPGRQTAVAAVPLALPAPGAPAAGVASEPEVWIETTSVGTEACLSRGTKLIDELGGEAALKSALAAGLRRHSRSGEAAATAEEAEIVELFLNELGPVDTDGPITTVRISACFRRGGTEKFRQARLERYPATDDGTQMGAWQVVEVLGDRSGRSSGPWEAGWRALPGSEVEVLAVENGWIKTRGPASRPLWFPIEDTDVGRRFSRRDDLVVEEEPIFSRRALANFSRKAPPTMPRDDGGQFACGCQLPSGLQPYTIDVYIRVPREEFGRDLCIISWGADRGSDGEPATEQGADHGLTLSDGIASMCCGLRSARKVNDGVWHHIACTFDGRERRLWVDFELVAVELVEQGVEAESTTGRPKQSQLSIGMYTPRLAKRRMETGAFRGEMKQLHVWKAALSPAALRAHATASEVRVRQEVGEEAAAAVFSAIALAEPAAAVVAAAAAVAADESRGDGEPTASRESFAAVLGCNAGPVIEALLPQGASVATRTQWLDFCCRGLRDGGVGEEGLLLFLRACVRNLGQLGRAISPQPEWRYRTELPQELGLAAGAAHGWRVEAKPMSLSDSMLEHIKDESLAQFQRQVKAAHALLGRGADEAVVELADRAALQQGNHDESWSKMLTVAEWSSAQPRWKEQAVEHARLGELSCREKLQHVLAWALASKRSLSQALPPPLNTFADDAAVEALHKAAVEALGGGTAEECSELAAALLAKDSSASCQASVNSMFREVVISMLFCRFLILLELNCNVGRDFLPLIDLAAPAESAYGKLLAQVKPRLLGHLKFAQFQRVLQNTKFEGSTPVIILNRKFALSLREKGRVDWEFRKSLVGQFMAEFRKLSLRPKHFRRPWQSRCIKVQFKGEGGEDAGGLYREALDAVAQELHSRAVPLLVPCPNAVAEVGENRDAWVLNPRAAAPECIRALELVGQLLGLALRTGDLLPLTFAPFTWKGIVGDARTREDIRSIDIFAEKHLALLSTDLGHADEEALAGMGALQFAYPDVTGEEIELVEGGRDILVTSENASEFTQLLLRNRLTFDSLQLQALRRGLATVVPIQLLRLWSWRDLQERVCGVPEVDLDNLRRHSTYKNCTASTEHVKFMWAALESFSQKQRRAFLRFVWGRSSLPTVERWERNFTVQLLSGTDDSRLPCSHTCFFTLDLPMYSTAAVCHAKLLYCITNCLAIDADGAAARALDWDEDDDD